tara:strand:- start:744 stop:1028 length:285 start_codon:yes stop_codon:yes gene_type:complete
MNSKEAVEFLNGLVEKNEGQPSFDGIINIACEASKAGFTVLPNSVVKTKDGDIEEYGVMIFGLFLNESGVETEVAMAPVLELGGFIQKPSAKVA